MARGALLDEEALADLLETGRLRGAVLDVFREEPLAPDESALAAPHGARRAARLARCRRADSGRGSSICSSTTGAATCAASRCATSSTSTQDTELMEKIIKAAVDRGASDLHIKAGDVFRARIHGELVAADQAGADAGADAHDRAAPHDRTRTTRRGIDKITDYDCSWSARGDRALPRQHHEAARSFSIIMRVIPFEVPTFEKLGLPPVLAKIAEAERGMVLVTGVTGSGKSSTMAALINYINAHENRHILTLENPIEFLHRDIQSVDHAARDRLGHDGLQDGTARRAASGSRRHHDRRDARRRDDRHGDQGGGDGPPADVDAAHAGRAEHDPPHHGDVPARGAGSRAHPPRESLHAVISQRLLPRADGKGRAVAAEIMIVTPAIAT